MAVRTSVGGAYYRHLFTQSGLQLKTEVTPLLLLLLLLLLQAILAHCF
jgi:hypothetical protein